jgi:hypothetical protein
LTNSAAAAMDPSVLALETEDFMHGGLGIVLGMVGVVVVIVVVVVV